MGDTLSLFTDITGKGEWRQCMSVDNVQLPTGYYFGMSAATGDLSGKDLFLCTLKYYFTDTHDIISVKMFEQEFARVEKPGEVRFSPFLFKNRLFS